MKKLESSLIVTKFTGGLYLCIEYVAAKNTTTMNDIKSYSKIKGF